MSSDWFGPIMAQVRGLVRSKIEGGADGVEWWQYADQALATVETAQDAIESIGREKFEQLLTEATVGDQSAEALVARLSVADADEVIEVVQSGAVLLDFNTQERQRRRDDLVAMLKGLGQIGCTIIRGLVIGAL